jgi:hypothetical protein
MALKWGPVSLAAITLIGTSVGYGAQYELGSPFAISCEGRLDSKGGQYFFSRDHKVKSDSDDNEQICSLATIAEKTTKTPLSRYTLREATIRRLLGTCSLGNACRITGCMNGLSHDVYFFVKIDSVSTISSDAKPIDNFGDW